jgi:hypothetical protein
VKKVFQKIMSISLALLLLVSTTSWKVEKHYCMGHLMDISFFTASNSCGIEIDLSKDNDTSIQYENSCCADVTILMQGQDDLALSYNDFTIDHQQFFIAFAYSYFDNLQTETFQTVKYNYYPPPLIVKDIQLFDKVFLI